MSQLFASGGHSIGVSASASPFLFGFKSKLQFAVLDKSQPGTKIARRNTNKLRYADDTTLMAGSKDMLKTLMIRVKEESKKMVNEQKLGRTQRLGHRGNSSYWALSLQVVYGSSQQKPDRRPAIRRLQHQEFSLDLLRESQVSFLSSKSPPRARHCLFKMLRTLYNVLLRN